MRLVDLPGPGWVACEFPERPYDGGDIRFHFGCKACLIAYDVADALGLTRCDPEGHFRALIEHPLGGRPTSESWVTSDA